MNNENNESQPLIANQNFHHRNYNSGTEDSANSQNIGLNLLYGNGREHNDNTEKYVQDLENITFTWSDINVFTVEKIRTKPRLLPFSCKNEATPSTRKQILKNVSGIARPGELLAILGSSGAGKTTLLNVLTSRSSSRLIVTGLRCANGVPVTSNSLTSKLAYVQQEDLFIGSLTVKEHLVFQALVRMDKHIPYRQRMERVEEVISELGLRNCQDTLIGIRGRLKGISGGEMKRLSFAAEVLTNPSLMFCDEPTSGLDSFMALNVVQVLKRLAQTGKTIVCTIHQPSSELYSMFDKLLLMAQGRVAFLGAPSEVDAFFTSLEAPCPHNYNPADYFIQLLAILPGREESCRQAVNLICDRFERSEYGIKLSVEAATVSKPQSNGTDYPYNGRGSINRYKASWFAQFRAVLWRSCISVLKEPLLIKVRLLQTTMIALIIGIIFFGQVLNEDGVMNINGALFMFLTSTSFQNTFAVINVFCSELPVFLREHRNGMYRVDVYFLCKTLADMPLFIFIPVVFLSICYYLIGLNAELPRIFIAMGILILVTNVAVSFGYMISCLSSSVSMALSIAPTLTIPFILFGGFLLNVASIPFYLKWISYMSWFRYGDEALMINQWSGVENIHCNSNISFTCPHTGRIILEVYHFSEENLVINILGLVVLICFYRFLAFFVLLIKTYVSE